MDIGTSGCLQKKSVWIDFDSQWEDAVLFALIVSWCEVSIGSVESPVAIEVGVGRVFFELVPNSSLEYSLDFSKVDGSMVKRCIPHPGN